MMFKVKICLRNFENSTLENIYKTYWKISDGIIIHTCRCIPSISVLTIPLSARQVHSVFYKKRIILTLTKKKQGNNQSIKTVI